MVGVTVFPRGQTHRCAGGAASHWLTPGKPGAARSFENLAFSIREDPVLATSTRSVHQSAMNTNTTMNTIVTASVLAFFSGKACDAAIQALGMLFAAQAQGEWPPHFSRKVKAALSKVNRLEKLARDSEEWRYDRKGNRLPGFVSNAQFEHGDPRRDALWSMRHAMKYGQHEHAMTVDISALMGSGMDGIEPETRVAIEGLVREFVAYREAFKPVVELLKRLDATRPKPVFTTMNASPTITKTMDEMQAAKVEVCPMKFFEVERRNKKTGALEIVTICRCVWPEGTVFNTSRFNSSKCQCESCGHAIKNPFNWVPLVVTHKNGTPQGLFVGRDCAETLFGVKLTGELEISGGPGGVVTV